MAEVDTKFGYMGMFNGARHRISLERRCPRTACSRGWLNVQFRFVVKAESGVYQTWIIICMGRYEERLAQQDSGAALSKSSMYIGALIRWCLQGTHSWSR